MKVHITNLYGRVDTIGKAQYMTADIAKKYLHFNELGIYNYPMQSDTPDMLRTRMDGIIASVSHGDIVIFQLPTWNGFKFDEAFVSHFNGYRDLKKIFFIHDIPPLQNEGTPENLEEYIAFFNRADLIILPSQGMVDFLRARGLTVPKIVIQRMWDSPVDIDLTKKPEFRKRMNYATSIVSFIYPFIYDWKSDRVEMAITAEPEQYIWGNKKEMRFIGWFNNQTMLAAALRKSGGFGLLWRDNPMMMEYMKINACCKLGAYLSAGLPVIVQSSHPEAEVIRKKKLGITVDSIEEAIEKVDHTKPEEYDQMVQAVDTFSYLVRNGYFTKKMLIDAVFQLLYD
ncbi:MAG: hypothetical protein NC489_17520 [Ruminococcus flavefaciens]|nr:hypothetical protein [Ruminococcus flavefaciens]